VSSWLAGRDRVQSLAVFSRNPLSRRRLLKLGGFAAVATAAGAWWFRQGSDAHYVSLAPGSSPEVLTAKELGVLAVFCDRVCPAPSETHPGPRALRVAERIDRELRFHTATLQGDVKDALFLVEHGGLLHFELRRFTRLGPGEQDARLDRLARRGSGLERQAVQALRFLALFFYYCDERTWAAIHYDGPSWPRKAPEADSRMERRIG
jgi:hypothetical protein